MRFISQESGLTVVNDSVVDAAAAAAAATATSHLSSAAASASAYLNSLMNGDQLLPHVSNQATSLVQSTTPATLTATHANTTPSSSSSSSNADFLAAIQNNLRTQQQVIFVVG